MLCVFWDCETAGYGAGDTGHCLAPPKFTINPGHESAVAERLPRFFLFPLATDCHRSRETATIPGHETTHMVANDVLGSVFADDRSGGIPRRERRAKLDDERGVRAA